MPRLTSIGGLESLLFSCTKPGQFPNHFSLVVFVEADGRGQAKLAGVSLDSLASAGKQRLGSTVEAIGLRRSGRTPGISRGRLRCKLDRAVGSRGGTEGGRPRCSGSHPMPQSRWQLFVEDESVARNFLGVVERPFACSMFMWVVLVCLTSMTASFSLGLIH
jgi:hypothetical protein